MRLKNACVDAGQYGVNVSPDEYRSSGIRMLRTSDLAEGRLAPDEEGVFLDGPIAAPQLLEEHDLLLSRAGTIGRSYLVPKAGVGSTFAGFLVRFRPAPGADPRFLNYALRAKSTQDQIKAEAVTSTIQNFNADRYANLAIPDATAEEQRRIADFLDDRVARIDQIITARRRQIALVDEQIRSLSDELLDGLHEPWGRLGSFVRRIEQGWSPQCDAVQASASEWGVLKVGAVQPGWFDGSENKRLPDNEQPKPEYEVRAGDLLVSRANTPQRVGFFAVVPSDVRPRLILCDKIMRIDVDETFDPAFVALVGQSRRTRDGFTLAGTGTSGSMVNIRGDDVRDMAIPVLSRDSQGELVHLWRSQSRELQSSKALLNQSIDLLSEYKQSLIAAAVTGELGVTTASSAIGG